MEDSVTLEQVSTQLPPHFIKQYEKLMALIDIKPSTQSTTKYGTAERFMEIYTAATQSLPSTLHAICYVHGILEGLGWTESSLESLRDLTRGDYSQLHPQVVHELMRLNCKPMEAAIMIILRKIAHQLGMFQCSQYYLAVCVLIGSRHLTDHTFMEQFDAVKKSFARHSLAVAFTCSVLERAGWGDTVELRKYAASDFHLEKQYPLIDLCLTVAAYFSNMTDTDYRTAKVFISTTHLNSQAVDGINQTDFVLLLKDRNIISPGNVSRIEDKERYPIFFKDYKDNYSKFFPPETSSAVIVTPDTLETEQTETKCSAEIQDYEKKLVELQEPSSVSGPHRRLSLNMCRLKKDWGDTSIFMSTIYLAKQLVQEANFLSEALHLDALFKVALTIPKSILSLCEYQSSEQLTSDEIAIRLIYKQRRIDSIWPLNTLIEKVQMMRNMCEFSENERTDGSTGTDSLFITEENHTLLGVAHMYLKCLYYGISAIHEVPIIGPAGKDVGTLTIKVALKPMKRPPSSIEVNKLKVGTHIDVEISVIEASHLPAAYTHILYCQYRFWKQEREIVVSPLTEAKPAHHSNEVQHRFQHEQVFNIEVTEDFLEYIQKEALAIEVWGRKKEMSLDEITEAEYGTCSLSQIWNDVTQYIQLWVDIREVNLHGDYLPVGTQVREDVKCGRIFQLCQDQFRRIHVRVVQVPNSGNGPLICDSISSVSIGSIFRISKNESRKNAPIDSYQEKDLERLQTKLTDQKKHLVVFTRELMKQGEVDAVTDKELKHQWTKQLGFYQPGVILCVPKAPVNLQDGLEKRIPVIFLDINNVDDDMKMVYSGELYRENAEDMVDLPLKSTKKLSKDQLKAVAHWDPGAHKTDCLNRVTAAGSRIYAIVQVGIKLQNPPDVEIQLKKRICMKINRLREGQSGEATKDTGCGVMFQLVTDIPMIEQPSITPPHCLLIDLEENDNAIEKINAGVRTIAETLELDRLKQEYYLRRRLHEHSQHIPDAEINEIRIRTCRFVSDGAKGSDIHVERITHLQEGKIDISQATTAGIITQNETTDILQVSIGEKVMVEIKTGFKTGVIKFIGRTEFADGEWIGLELTRPEGKNNGSVEGVTYFKCKERHGIFVREKKIVKKLRATRHTE